MVKSLVRGALAVTLALAAIQATAEAQDKPRKQLRDRNKVSVEELRSAPSTTVFEFVRARRSHWLSTRGQATLGTRMATDVTGAAVRLGVEPEIVVYVDNARQGGQSSLRSLSTEDVDSMEYLDASSATQRFGTGHPHGAIVIRRRVR